MSGGLLAWIRTHILRKPRSRWFKKTIKITYWTTRDNEAKLVLPELRWEAEEPDTVYVEAITVQRGK